MAILKRPLDPIELVRSLEDFDETRRKERLSVVFIDDDKLSADLNAEILRAADCDVEVVNDPKRAIEAVERIRPDLILMDLRMPEVDGMELAQVIGSPERWSPSRSSSYPPNVTRRASLRRDCSAATISSRSPSTRNG